MMLDLGPFSDENFDPKKWINAACQNRRPQDEESVEKHLVDLEMKLQLASEDIAVSLEEQSTSAILRVPRVTRDVVRLRDDALSLRNSVSSILIKLKKAEGSSAESIAALAKVDTVKQRMEAAYETLQDAAGLTQLSATVEEVFASGDLPRAAETLANMKHCLSAVGEVAEFANVKKQLEMLEDRLDSMVQPRLEEAISNRQIDAAQDLRSILTRIGRIKSLETNYTKVHMKIVKQLWENFNLRQISAAPLSGKADMERQAPNIELTPTSFLSWLPNFYDELLLYLEQEWKWCMVAFPDDFMSLVPKFLIDMMTSIGNSFVSRINLAIGDAVPETKTLAKGILDVLSGEMQKGAKIQSKHLETLIELHNMTAIFGRNIHLLFSDSRVQILAETLKAVYLPYEPFKQRYGVMERAILSSEISSIDLRGAVTRGVGGQGIELSETVRRMEESIPQVIVLLEAAVERCISFTGGSEADELIPGLDDIMMQYISLLLEALKSLRSVCGVDHPRDLKEPQALRRSESVSNDEEWSIVQGALQILTVADCLTSRFYVFEASLKATLASLSTTLSPQSSDEQNAPSDLAVLRLLDAPEKARNLQNLLLQSKDHRFHALPLASQRVAAFVDTVNELVYDVLISKVKQRLSDVSRLPIWTAAEEQSAHVLPTFNAYPQAYVTSVGEYLLTLPQQLEPLAEGISSGEEAQIFATEWMFKVAEGATALYIEQLCGIQAITDRGAQQLAVDIEYLSNVLSALSMPIPPPLSTFQSCLSVSRDELTALLSSDARNDLHFPTATLVSKIRKVAPSFS